MKAEAAGSTRSLAKGGPLEVAPRALVVNDEVLSKKEPEFINTVEGADCKGSVWPKAVVASIGSMVAAPSVRHIG